MTISEKSWVEYLDDLRKVNKIATDKMEQYLVSHPVRTREEMNRMIDYAYALSVKYGEVAAELACEMYDAIVILSGVIKEAAEPAPTATVAEVAKQLLGTRRNTNGNTEEMAASVGRLVKMAGADTMLQNAIRDGAEYAWIPHGDTCAFCIALAGNGWQPASKKALNGGHAGHIHSNCDCTYAIRFNRNTNYQGYSPDRYRAMYNDAEGSTPTEKINAMRRRFYAEDRERINEQKRSTYEKRKEREESSAEETNVN